MAKVAGRVQALQYNATAIGAIVDCSFSGEIEELDSTTHDSGAFREYLAGRMSGTLDVTMKWDQSDTAQSQMADDAFVPGTSRALDFRMETTGHKYTGTGFITNWSPSAPNDDVAEVSCTIRFTGTITQGSI